MEQAEEGSIHLVVEEASECRMEAIHRDKGKPEDCTVGVVDSTRLDNTEDNSKRLKGKRYKTDRFRKGLPSSEEGQQV